MISDYFFIGIKNLKRRGIRSWLTLLGIFIGIMAVVSLISLGDGLTAAVSSQIGAGSTEIITVQAGGLSSYGPPGSGAVNPLNKEDVEAISKIAHIDFAIGRNIDTIKVEFNRITNIMASLSIPEGYVKESYINNDLEAERGRLLEEGDTGGVLIGSDLSDKDKNNFNKNINPGDRIEINKEKFKVVGVLEKKGSFFIDGTVFIMEQDLKKIIPDYGDDVDMINVRVTKKEFMEEVKKDIEDLMRERRDVKEGEEDFEVSTPEAFLKTVNQILGGVKAFILLIAFASILVGAIGIINTMTTSVLERHREIGIMKAIGARNSNIFLLFFIEAGLMGLIGGALGIIFGILLGYIGTLSINTFIGSSSKPTINILLIILTLAGSFLIGSIAGILPAMKAAKQNPVEALR